MPKQASRDGVFERSDAPGWYISYIDARGKRRRERARGAYTRTQAVELLALVKGKVHRERITGVREVSELSTKEFLDRFKRHQKAELATTTYERLGDILNTLQKRLPAKLKEISRAVVSEYIITRSQEVAAATVSKEVATLKRGLHLAVHDWGLLHENPASGIKLPRAPKGRTRYLTPAELRAVLEAAPEWMRAPIGFAVATGMRRGEVLKLRWKDLDLAGKRAYLLETKNGNMRVVPLNELAFSVLSSLPHTAAGDLVFQGVDAHKLTVYTRRLFKRLHIEDASFHTTRHTTASWLTMQGVDLFTVSKLLGHEDLRMTARYAHLSPTYLIDAAMKLDTAFTERPALPSPIHGTPTGLTDVQTEQK